MSARALAYGTAGATNVVNVDPSTVLTASRGKPNKVSTARFTLVTWLPKSLFFQFQRVANIYFFFVSAACIFADSQGWAPYGPSTTLIPFCVVLFWTALKDMYEDIRRKRDDDAENFRKCWRYDKVSQFVQVFWQDVVPGDILLTLENELFPADLLLICSKGGEAHISTANLDGETNLKERRPPDLCGACTMATFSEAADGGGDAARNEWSVTPAIARLISELQLEVKLDSPRVSPTENGGSVAVSHAPNDSVRNPCPLTFENFAPRGCMLRNTAWICSVVAYAGNDTKTRLNVQSTTGKMSNMQVYLNRCVQGLIATLCVLCLLAAIMSEVHGAEYDWWVMFIQYWIILYQIVPISLYVCFEIVKLALGFQINFDKQMIDPRTNLGATARTADLVEELGQVDFIFSDKTGTLTENEMVFARCCVAGWDPGDFRGSARSSKGPITKSSQSTAGGISEAMRILASPSDPLHQPLRWFFYVLAVCHDVQVERREEDGELLYSGSSPDEVAFLEACHKVGVSFHKRRRNPGSSTQEIYISFPAGEGEQVFTVLDVIPFTSDRKRMTVVCEYKGEYWCMTKGADNVMTPLLGHSIAASSMESLNRFSKLGLRTLTIATRQLEKPFFEDWHLEMNAAANATEGREDLLAAAAAKVETKLILAGISAIEDKLQMGVPEAIVTLKAAGIRFWVLTGDKTETAVEIVRSCRLFTEDMTLAYMTEITSQMHALEALGAAEKQLAGVSKKGLSVDSKAGLVLDGTFVTHCLDSPEARRLLYKLAVTSSSCVCCRLTPSQKRKLVELVRIEKPSSITLAIGDGANDVSMIQGAHLGIGVHGKEGNQAVQASDVAIPQFRCLVPLLLCHGRRAYRRVGTFLLYYIYKHVVLVTADMLWAAQYKYNGSIAYPEWLSSAYSLMFTSLPIMVIQCFDRDVPDEVANSNPQMYIEGIKRSRFNLKIFAVWILSGLWHGALAWLPPSLVFGGTDPEQESFWLGSIVSFSLVIIAVQARLMLIALNRCSVICLGMIMLSLIVYAATLTVFGHTAFGEWMQPEVKGLPVKIFTQFEAWLTLVITPFGLLVDVAIYAVGFAVFPTELDKVRRSYARGTLPAKIGQGYEASDEEDPPSNARQPVDELTPQPATMNDPTPSQPGPRKKEEDDEAAAASLPSRMTAEMHSLEPKVADEDPGGSARRLQHENCPAQCPGLGQRASALFGCHGFCRAVDLDEQVVSR